MLFIQTVKSRNKSGDEKKRAKKNANVFLRCEVIIKKRLSMTNKIVSGEKT